MVIAQEGQKAKLECEAYSQLATPIEFEWFKNGLKLTDLSLTTSANLTAGKYRGTLTFASVKKTASAFYTCKARGVRGLSNSSTAITLNVTCKFVVFLALTYMCFFYKDPPQNVKVIANSTEFVKGKRIILNCSAEANPLSHRYSWWKDGQLLKAGSESQFLFSKLNYSDNGAYKCEARNSVNSSMSGEFVLVVKSMPSFSPIVCF